MRLDVVFVPDELKAMELATRRVVVIDVLRATTTAVTALANGARWVRPVADVEEARSLAREANDTQRLLLGGERNSVPPAGFDCGNSPLEYTPEVVSDAGIVLTTTNGTQAFAAVGSAAHVAAGCFLNLAGTGRWLTLEEEDALLVCAGTHGRFSLDDAVVAGALVSEVLSQKAVALGDAARAAFDVWERWGQRAADALRASEHGARLMRMGFEDDVAYCARLNALADTVPVLTEAGLTVGRGAHSGKSHTLR